MFYRLHRLRRSDSAIVHRTGNHSSAGKERDETGKSHNSGGIGVFCVDRSGVPDGGDGLVGSIFESFRPWTGVFGKFWVGG